MGKIFPIFFGFISLTIPAGVVVYFAASNVWQIAQQAIMFRKKTGSGEAKPAKPVAKDEPPKDTKPEVKPAPKPRPPSGRAQRQGGNGARSPRGGTRSKGKPKRR
jgi:membrane protein insertase Oxa1/YidC/SpoIIIJ